MENICSNTQADQEQYANIIIDIAHESVDKIFQYKIPERLRGEVCVGQEVVVPFGKGNRSRKGYVIELTNRAEYDVEKLKELTGIAKESVAIESQLIQLASWLRRTYGSTMIQALKTVLPVKDKVQGLTKSSIRLAAAREAAQETLRLCRKKKYHAKVRLLEALLVQPCIPERTVRDQMKISTQTIQALIRDGIIVRDSSPVYRNPVEQSDQVKEFELNASQSYVVEQIHAVFEEKDKKPFLLHGITGSGKTQVYVELVARAAAAGRASIVLIPEIALTRQTVMRFYNRFGSRVSIIHSKLSKGERYDQFERAKKGELDVIIGPRSALFTPFSNIGYIIIDEEHESSYKSDSVPKYHARDTAIARAGMTGATVLLASATPSVDSYYRARNGQYRLLTMKERISNQGLAHAQIVDMREELQEGNRSIFSRRLKELIEDRLSKGQQTLLFLNRRGYHGFISCRSCGKAVKCPNCDVTLSAHNNGKLICHYCGYEQQEVTKCPSCGSPYIGGFRVGTEQAEEQVKKTFPRARVLRMDLDTTKRKHGHETIVSAFANQEADILIGTQMIVKGHDFPNVTLVGILAADMSLQVSHFRSAERTFQLLVQAAGRAGRGSAAGQVVIQTYNPQHYSIQLAQKQVYEEFYEQEMKFRAVMGYPPAGNLLEIFLSAPEETAAIREINQVKCIVEEFIIDSEHPWINGQKEEFTKDSEHSRINRQKEKFTKDSEHSRINDQKGQYKQLQMMGPAPASIAKLNNRYRQVIYVKSAETEALFRCRQRIEDSYQPPEDIQLQFDIQL